MPRESVEVIGGSTFRAIVLYTMVDEVINDVKFIENKKGIMVIYTYLTGHHVNNLMDHTKIDF